MERKILQPKALLVFGLTLLVLMPVAVFAQEEGMESDTFGFANSVSLWIAIIIGFITSGMVLRNAKKIGGGVLGSVYKFFGIGMLLVVLGFLAVVIPFAWAPPFVIGRVHDLLFIAGYAVMAVGAKKILTAAGLE